MPIDRAVTLRNAEKFLRQGKLNLAIAEYVRIVSDQPQDWASANMLGDLYLRGGRTDMAVVQFTRIADSLSQEGFLQKAGALYKKILKIKPDDEHALLQSAEIAGAQGLLADARGYLNAVAGRRRARGDRRGVAVIRVRLGSLDPADIEARVDAARARAEVGDATGAVTDLKAVAGELTEAGRAAAAVDLLREAATLSPGDAELRGGLFRAYLASGDFDRARECAATADQLKSLAAALEVRGLADQALGALRDAARLDPADADLRARLVGLLAARGDLAAAAEYLAVGSAGVDPRLLLRVAEFELYAGKTEGGIALIEHLLREDPRRREEVAQLGWLLAAQAPDAGFRVVEIAANTAVAQSDWPGAAAALQEFVTRVAGHIPALTRLVGISVDGGLEATASSAQAQLADAYIAAGSAAQARPIVEDLMAREPWERANVERLRRVLVLLGEPDPDALIADRLSGQSPFTGTDLSPADLPLDTPVRLPSAAVEQAAPSSAAAPSAPSLFQAPVPASDGGSETSQEPRVAYPESEVAAAPVALGVAPDHEPGTRGEEPERFELSPIAVDLEHVLADLEGPKPRIEADDLEGVFAQLREEASRQSTAGAAEAFYNKGLALRDAGRIDEAVRALRDASRDPRLRFQAASLLGRIYRDRNAMLEAIEWFEQAAEAPPPTADQGHLLLYDLADALEAVGESARALAVWLELQADAGDYRDVSLRVDHLAKGQTKG